MKQGITQYMPIEFDISLDEVSSIDFKFAQQNVSRVVTYPSSGAVRRASTNIVDVEFDAEETWRWTPGTVYIDTVIHISGSNQSPTTPITSVRLDKTLFTKDELS